ncbi:GbsR/MarR family transcriptional regulator [Halalkalibacillus sediminis]|uniref:HTH-type transcriptional regulator n=1 Tax=Halalkalibacillus sediminis TaxID=2018042 RepID=A0A2I0QVB1_9BACI|nr:GbsR/MarR family transcriptional regulator [Halalkalibacillus sediminis]PKR78266.1 GbsR/MarR family transcriptional regulator [Halalkalibacillus sediminis]
MANQENEKYWEEYDKVIEQFIQVIAKNMTLYGITPSVGRLYGALYFSEEPMTLDDMRDQMGMSKTSMSTGVKSLADMKMVEPSFKRGVRKDLYQSEEDWYKSFTSLFGNRWRHHTETNIEEADEAIQLLEEIRNETTDEDLIDEINRKIDRLVYARNYYEWLMDFIRVVETGQIFDFVPKKSHK